MTYSEPPAIRYQPPATQRPDGNETFSCLDAGAGYYISREPVEPLAVKPIHDLLGELARRDVELRITPSLWKLYNAVAGSTLQFSIIRMRNARPRG